MKGLVYTYGLETIEMIKAEQALPVEVQRLKYFTNKVTPNQYGSGSHRHFMTEKAWWNEDNKFHYTRDKYTIYLSTTGKLFTRSTTQHGLTYNPAETVGKCLTLWRGTAMTNVSSEAIIALLKSHQCEWALEFKSLFTKTLLARVLKGRITNGEDFMRAYLKTSNLWKSMQISHRAPSMLKLMRANPTNGIMEYHDMLSHVNNVEATIDMLLGGKNLYEFSWYQTPHTEGIRRELNILGRKINSTWSLNRLNDEHTQMSRELRALELESMESIDYAYSSPAPLLPGMELIDNNKRLFEEGSVMNHCVYGYLQNAVNRKVFHFHCTFGDMPFTLAVQSTYSKDEFVVQQMFGNRNKACSDTQRNIVKQWLQEPSVQQWFKHEKLVSGVKQVDNITLPELPF
jgi:hypothetical protein